MSHTIERPEQSSTKSSALGASWVRALLVAGDLVTNLQKSAAAQPGAIGLREHWALSSDGRDVVTLVDFSGRPALLVAEKDFSKFADGKDVAEAVRGVGSSPEEARSALFSRLAGLPAQGADAAAPDSPAILPAILVVGKYGPSRKYYTLEPAAANPDETGNVRWTQWTPPQTTIMDRWFKPAPAAF